MSAATFYLLHVLPIVFVFAPASFFAGQLLGVLLWSHYGAKALSVESQNANLRGHVNRLVASRADAEN